MRARTSEQLGVGRRGHPGLALQRPVVFALVIKYVAPRRDKRIQVLGDVKAALVNQGQGHLVSEVVRRKRLVQDDERIRRPRRQQPGVALFVPAANNPDIVFLSRQFRFLLVGSRTDFRQALPQLRRQANLTRRYHLTVGDGSVPLANMLVGNGQHRVAQIFLAVGIDGVLLRQGDFLPRPRRRIAQSPALKRPVLRILTGMNIRPLTVHLRCVRLDMRMTAHRAYPANALLDDIPRLVLLPLQPRRLSWYKRAHGARRHV